MGAGGELAQQRRVKEARLRFVDDRHHALSLGAGDPAFAEAPDELARALAELRDCAGAAWDVSAAGG